MPRAGFFRERYICAARSPLPIDLQLFYCFVPVFNSKRQTIAFASVQFLLSPVHIYVYTKGDFRLLIFSRHDSHCIRDAALNLSILIGTQFALIVNSDCFFSFVQLLCLLFTRQSVLPGEQHMN